MEYNGTAIYNFCCIMANFIVDIATTVYKVCENSIADFLTELGLQTSQLQTLAPWIQTVLNFNLLGTSAVILVAFFIIKAVIS